MMNPWMSLARMTAGMDPDQSDGYVHVVYETGGIFKGELIKEEYFWACELCLNVCHIGGGKCPRRQERNG